MKFIAVTKYWHRYCWLVCIILLGYGLVKTFSPNVKVVETTKIVVDTEAVEKAESEIVVLNKTISTITREMEQLKKINTDIQSNTTIVEIIHPDGTIERRTETTVSDTSTTETTSSSHEARESIATGSTTDTETVDTTTTTHSDTDTMSTTEKNPMPFWSTIGGYQYKERQYLIGQGINIGQHLMLGVLSSYKYHAADNISKWDVGAVMIVRY